MTETEKCPECGDVAVDRGAGIIMCSRIECGWQRDKEDEPQDEVTDAQE